MTDTIHARMLADLREAASTLRRYETLHRAKNTDESTAKAEVNAALAERFEATIALATAPRHTIKKTADTAILEWLERWHTLHYRVEMLYVVDGYEVTITYDDTPVPGCSWKQPTLYDALREAARAQPEPPVRGAPR